MKKAAFCFVLGGISLMSGCGGNYEYRAATSDPLPFQHARTECKLETKNVGLLYFKDAFAACMYRRGWDIRWED